MVAKHAGHFKKGQSGNPGGRPKGFKGMASKIRKETNEGEELVDFALGVLRNAAGIFTFDQQWGSLKWLADRGFGKAIDIVELHQGDSDVVDTGAQWSGLSTGELEELEQSISDAANN
jgi:hypothetical protein